jgi:hypothetical protein
VIAIRDPTLRMRALLADSSGDGNLLGSRSTIYSGS